jgi:anti-sigma regulatory factor (Ser/Thr protein kinase)
MPHQVFPGTLDSLAPIRGFVAQASASAGLDRDASYNLCLAVDEIATNVVMHGYGAAGLKGDIRVETAVEPGRLVVRMEDTGRPYDPNEHDLPETDDLAAPLHERGAGGLGIMLAFDGVDDLQYASAGGRNVHTFVVNLAQQKRAAR